MKNRTRLIRYAAAIFLIPIGVESATLSLEPVSPSVEQGTSFTLLLRVSGLGDFSPPSLGAFDLDVTYDAGRAQFDSLTLGDPTLGDLLAPVQPSLSGSTANPGVLNLFSVSQDSPSELDGVQPGQFTLAVLNFTALSPGNALFDLNNVILGGANAEALPVDAILNATVHIVPGQAVPEAVPAWVAILALGGLACTHARLRRQSNVAL